MVSSCHWCRMLAAYRQFSCQIAMCVSLTEDTWVLHNGHVLQVVSDISLGHVLAAGWTCQWCQRIILHQLTDIATYNIQQEGYLPTSYCIPGNSILQASTILKNIIEKNFCLSARLILDDTPSPQFLSMALLLYRWATYSHKHVTHLYGPFGGMSSSTWTGCPKSFLPTESMRYHSINNS